MANFGGQSSDHLGEKSRLELEKISNCLVLVIAEEVPLGLGMDIFQRVASCNNQVILQLKNPNAGMSVCIPLETIIQFQDGRSWPVVYWDTKVFVLSSPNITQAELCSMAHQYFELLTHPH